MDFSAPEAQAMIREVIDAILETRQRLSDPATAHRVGHYERLYERSLGLAVAPVLLLRAIRRGRSADGVGASAKTGLPDLASEIRRELVFGVLSRKMALYERSLGLAVIPVLLRRAAYMSRQGTEKTSQR